MGDTIILTNNAGTTTCGPYTLSGATTTAMATNLVTSIGSGCSLATATCFHQHSHDHGKDCGLCRQLHYGVRHGDVFNAFYVVHHQHHPRAKVPNYVSGITITDRWLGLPAGDSDHADGRRRHRRNRRSQHHAWQPPRSPISRPTVQRPAMTWRPDSALPTRTTSSYSSVWGPVLSSRVLSPSPNPGPVTYGVSPITLTATDSACNLPITYTVNSGPGTVNSNVLTVTGAGTILITAAQAGNSNYLPSSQQISITVNKAALTITANGASMTYGGSLPTFGYTPTGFVNGDGSGVLSGAPNETTTATSSSNVGPYTITITQGTLTAANYSFTFVNGTLDHQPGTVDGNRDQHRHYLWLRLLAGADLRHHRFRARPTTRATPPPAHPPRALGNAGRSRHLPDHHHPGHAGGDELHVHLRQWHL